MFGMRNHNNSKKAIPEGQRIYAIGDVHGRLDLLQLMAEKIKKDIKRLPKAETTEIYLGDYIDRGQNSSGVINWLTTETNICDHRICLRGNHELYPLTFMSDHNIYGQWKYLGGRETLISYNLNVPLFVEDDAVRYLQQKFIEAMPDEHVAFLTGLPNTHTVGDYFFVHAGVRPGIALDKQRQDDLLWIREDFLESRYDFGKVIVHGHTPVENPETLFNRVNIDTGAYATNILTCLVLEGSERRFIHT